MRWLTSNEGTARGAAMDAPTISGTQLFPEREFDRKVEIRAENHERLRGRNNVTLCRSPTRDFDSGVIKNELKEKRHLEFLRRRSVSPESRRSKCAICSSKTKPRQGTFTMRRRTPSNKSEMLHTKEEMSCSPTIQTQKSRESDDPSINRWALLWSEPVTPTRQKNNQARKQFSIFNATTESSQHWMKHADRSIKVQTAKLKTSKESSAQTETVQKKTLRETSVQTESGLVTVKESDVQRLSDYIQEALWREEAVKKKLAALQESGSNLLNSTNMIWITRCSEDLLRSKIKTLEAQLQVCLQKNPKDGVKKLVQQMEKQRVTYEEKLLVALQRATQEKAEALSKTETLQEALITVQAEALRWQSLFEELKLNSGQLMEKQHISVDQLQQLHSHLEYSRATEVELKEEIASLRLEKQELHYNISLLEQDNQTLREEIQNFQDDGSANHNLFMKNSLESPEPRLTANRDSHLEEQLRHAQQKLQLKEKECEELQTELHAMEQECQSSQARLSQCREELRLLSHRRSTPTPCSSWWKVWVFFLLFLTLAGVAMLWMWHPPFREQAEVLYSDIETRIEDYLIEMASPRYSGCFRPV